MSAGADTQGLFWALRTHELGGDGLDLTKAWALLEEALGLAAFLMVGLFCCAHASHEMLSPLPSVC